MNKTEQLLEWLVCRGVDRDQARLLFAEIQVPPTPEALTLVLIRFRHAVSVMRASVYYTDQQSLDELDATAGQIIDVLNAGEDSAPGEVFSDHSRQRPLYHTYPLYGALQRAHAHEARAQEYYWLLGLLILIRPYVGDSDMLERYGQWCMAVRAFGEAGVEGEAVPPAELLKNLSDVVSGSVTPGEGLRELREATRGSRRQDHARLLETAWRYLLTKRVRTRRGWGGGGGGYRAIRGVPPGWYVFQRPVRGPKQLHRASGGSDWGAAPRQVGASDDDGHSRGGDAAADAATPGEVQWPDTGSEFAVAYYTRGEMWQAGRRRQLRAARSGQDTLLNATAWTPQQIASIVHGLILLHDAPDSSTQLRRGSALCIVGLLTGIEREQLKRIGCVDDLEALTKPAASFALVAGHAMAWRPQREAGGSPRPGQGARSIVRSAVAWVCVPVPGMVSHIVNTLTASGNLFSASNDACINLALKRLAYATGHRVQWRQLRRHWWGWMAAVTGQPSLATAITGYFRPATAVPQHYLHVPASLQHSAYLRAYDAFVETVRAEFQHLGLDWRSRWSEWPTSSPPGKQPGSGSAIVPQTDQLSDCLESIAAKAGQGLDWRQTRAERLTAILYHSLSLWSGLRATKARPSHAALLLHGYRVVSDKDTPAYTKARMQHLPPSFHNRLQILWERRTLSLQRAGLLAGALPERPELPRSRDEVIEFLRDTPQLSMSFVGGATGARLEQLTPTQIRERRGLDIAGLPRNWQRHWLRTHLLVIGCPDQAANAWMGHACLGQDPWGKASCMYVGSELKHLASQLEPTVTRLLGRMEKIDDGGSI